MTKNASGAVTLTMRVGEKSFEVEMRVAPLEQVTHHPANPRKHGPKNIAAIKSSLKTFGQRYPIVVNQAMQVLAGNGRLDAMRELGWREAMVAVASMSDADQLAFMVADNRTAELAEWDEDALAVILRGMRDMGRLPTTGYDDEALNVLLQRVNAPPGSASDDGPPMLQDKAVTDAGDIWLMDGHKLICGDCRNAKDVGVLIGSEKVAIAITSPPYAAQREYDSASGFEPIRPDRYCDWFQLVQELVASVLAKDGSWFVNIKDHCDDGERVLYVKDLVVRHVRSWGWMFVDEFAWVHGGTPKAPAQRFKNGWEPVFQFTRGRHKFRPKAVRHKTDSVPKWGGAHPSHEAIQGAGSEYISPTRRAIAQGDDQCTTRGGTGVYVSASALAYPSNVIQCGKNREATGHPAAFPVSLPAFFLAAYSDEGDVVYDPFSGSGSVLMACEELGRVGRMAEISPRYCDVIVRRWQEKTKKPARMASSGKTFDEVSAERAK